jgi:hypothetical protein
LSPGNGDQPGQHSENLNRKKKKIPQNTKKREKVKRKNRLAEWLKW